jgi:hypothetical protein
MRLEKGMLRRRPWETCARGGYNEDRQMAARLRSRFLVALDAGSVAGTVVAPGIGSPRMGTWVRVPLPAGALRPSALEANFAEAGAVAAALAVVRQGLGARRRGTVVVLPEGVARLALLQAPKGVDIREFARFRLAQALPYPATEAVVDVLTVGRGSYLCGSVRRSIVQSYEAAAEAAGFPVDRVDVAPLVATAALKRLAGPDETGVALFLGDVALSMAGFARGKIAAFRTRLRSPGVGEAEWLVDEISRTAVLAGSPGPTRILVLGLGAPDVAESLRSLGCEAMAAAVAPAEGGLEWDDRTWMRGAFA